MKKITEAVLGFTNPFQVENKEELYCLSSGIPATQEVSNNLLQALELGKDAMVTFFEKRFVDKSGKFHEPIQRMKIKTFASMQTSQKIKSTQSKLIEVRAERNVFAQLVLLSLKNNIDLEIIMSYQLGPVPWTLATADGAPVKSDKAKLLHNLEGTVDVSENPVREETVYIYDGNALLQAMQQVPDTFEEVADRVFNLLPKNQRVDFVTDSYHENSIKTFERRRRGITPTFLLAGPKTKTPRDWKSFMSNDDNKTQLIKLLLSEWKKPKYAERLHGRQLFFVAENASA